MPHLLFNSLANNMIAIETNRDVYKHLFRLFGEDITYEDTTPYFGERSRSAYDNVFTPIYVKVGIRLHKTEMAKRLKSARSRWHSLKAKTDDRTIAVHSVIDLLREQKFKCNHCQVYLTKDRHKQLDHIHPLSLGGEHTIKNVQWLCRYCNLSKGNRYVG